MNSYTKERIIGSTILLGGGLLLSAMLYRTGDDTQVVPNQTVVVTEDKIEENNRPSADVLTADYDTEQRILAKKREERAAQIAEREAAINALLAAQTDAKARAIAKAEKEAKKTVKLTPIQDDSLARTKNLIDEVEAESAKLKKLRKERANLIAEQKAADKKAQLLAKKKEKENKAKKQKELDYVAAKQRLRAARAKAANNASRYGVQVALAADQTSANRLADSIKKYGYKVSTSRTSRGVRVVVGPEKGRDAALAMRDKLHADKRVSVQGAWITEINAAQIAAQKAETKRAQLQRQADAKAKAAEQKAQKIAAEKQKQQLLADKKAAEEKQRFGVQVAMAGDAASRDALIAKLKQHGYKVTTSNTSRGTRIIVGAGSKKEAAQKLQAKVNADKRIGVSGAWLKRER